jgi:hypothetical protein
MSSNRFREHFPKDLADALERSVASDGIRIADLRKDDVIEIQTKNHVYALTVIDPSRALVLVASDGEHVPTPKEMTLAGSLISPFGSMIMAGRIALGHCVELTFAGPRRLVLTPTQAVSINGVRILPRDAEGGLAN